MPNIYHKFRKEYCCCKDCNNRLPDVPRYYIQFGNFCGDCLSEVTQNMKDKKKNGIKTIRQRLVDESILID